MLLLLNRIEYLLQCTVNIRDKCRDICCVRDNNYLLQPQSTIVIGCIMCGHGAFITIDNNHGDYLDGILCVARSKYQPSKCHYS